jgi:hypothetical protein
MEELTGDLGNLLLQSNREKKVSRQIFPSMLIGIPTVSSILEWVKSRLLYKIHNSTFCILLQGHFDRILFPSNFLFPRINSASFSAAAVSIDTCSVIDSTQFLSSTFHCPFDAVHFHCTMYTGIIRLLGDQCLWQPCVRRIPQAAK